MESKAPWKSVGFLSSPSPPPPPSRASLAAAEEEEEMDDWMTFKETGFLDEAEIERKDRLALLQNVEKLENEVSSDTRTAEESADMINSGRKETDAIDDGKAADGMVEIVPSSSLGEHRHGEGFHSGHARQERSGESSDDKVVRIVESTGDATGEHRNEFDDGNNAIELFHNEEEDGSIMNEDDDYNDDSDEGSDDPGMASVGKKIWTFFPT